MAVEKGARIEIGLDTKQAQKDAEDFGTKLVRSIVPTIDVFNLASKAAGLLGDTIVKVVGDEIAFEKQMDLVAKSLKNHGEASESARQDLEALNRALARQSDATRMEIAQLQHMFIAMGLHRVELEAATRATLGLANATGKGLMDAGKDVAKRYLGDKNALKEFAGAANDTREALRQLREEQSARASQTPWYESLLAAMRTAGAQSTRDRRSAAQNAALDAEKEAARVEAAKRKAADDAEAERLLRAREEDAQWTEVSKALDRQKQDNERRASQARAADAERERREAERLRRIEDDARREAQLVGWIEDQREAAFQRQVARERTEADLARSRKGLTRDFDIDQIRAQTEAANEANAGIIASAQNTDAMLKSIGPSVVGSLGQMAAGFMDAAVRSAIAGASFEQAAGQLVGGLVSSLGTMLVNMGTAALLGSALASVAPGIAALFGVTPAAAPVGAAMLAAGAVMVGVGAGISAVATPSTGSAAQAMRSTSSSEMAARAEPGFTRGGGETIVNNYSITFSRGFVAGSPRELARSLKDILDGGKRLQPGLA